MMMKTIATVAFLLLFGASQAEMDPTPVHVKVKCVGTDLAHATIPLGEYAGKLLEDTYAMVHSPLGHDDSNLTSLVFHGHGMMLEDYEAPKETVSRSGKTTAVYSGLFNCLSLCPDDGSGIMKKAWETMFASELANTEIAYFAKTKSCSIDVDIAPAEPPSTTNAEVEIKCKGVRLKKASVAEATFAAHALQAAYNYVHEHHEGDEKKMEHVAVVSKKSSKAMVAYNNDRLGTMGWSGLWYWQWLERLWASIYSGDPGYPKPGDDDLPAYCWDDDWKGLRTFNGGLTAIGAKKWEEKFTKYLRESEFKVFHKVKSCSISVKPTPELLEMLRDDGCPKRTLKRQSKTSVEATVEGTVEEA